MVCAVEVCHGGAVLAGSQGCGDEPNRVRALSARRVGHAAFGWRVSGLQAADEARTTLRRPSLVVSDEVPAEDGARGAVEGSVRLGVRHLPAV